MDNDLNGFEKAQDLAYEATSAVVKLLYEGMTEKEATELLTTYCRDSGVHAFFHKPFAWFGERSRYLNFKSAVNFLPTKRRLEQGDVVILDVAPILKGYVADVGHTFIFGNADSGKDQHLRARDLLLMFRENIPLWFESELSTKEIWEKVDQEIKNHGFDNIHKMYPFSVLGHRVHKVPLSNIPGILAPFGWHSLWSLVGHGFFPDLLGPKHKGSKIGVWAIEPHIGGTNFGAKFEELLFVTESSEGKISARWLSDNVPHLSQNWLAQ